MPSGASSSATTEAPRRVADQVPGRGRDARAGDARPGADLEREASRARARQAPRRRRARTPEAEAENVRRPRRSARLRDAGGEAAQADDVDRLPGDAPQPPPPRLRDRRPRAALAGAGTVRAVRGREARRWARAEDRQEPPRAARPRVPAGAKVAVGLGEPARAGRPAAARGDGDRDADGGDDRARPGRVPRTRGQGRRRRAALDRLGEADEPSSRSRPDSGEASCSASAGRTSSCSSGGYMSGRRSSAAR